MLWLLLLLSLTSLVKLFRHLHDPPPEEPSMLQEFYLGMRQHHLQGSSLLNPDQPE